MASLRESGLLTVTLVRVLVPMEDRSNPLWPGAWAHIICNP